MMREIRSHCRLFALILWVAVGSARADIVNDAAPGPLLEVETRAVSDQAHIIETEGISLWLKTRFSKAELEAFRPEHLRVESHFCGCYDKPNPHFPYPVVVFITPKGDLVARAEAREGALNITPLAVRRGKRYCELESEERCYGSFAHACEFTDFRFGRSLAEFFPTCKADEQKLLQDANAALP
jgi:hypothetical protein